MKQITVFLENEKGRLAALCNTLGNAGVDMRALTIADTAEYGLVRIICIDHESAFKALDEAGYRAIETEVLAVSVADEAGGLATLLAKLEDMNVNIQYGYCFSLGDQAVDILKVKDYAAASVALQVHGYKQLKETDL